MTIQNIAPNPEFAVNVSDGWSGYGTRDPSPPVALPSGCTAAMKITPFSTLTRVVTSHYYAATPGLAAWWQSCYLYRPGGYRTTIDAVFHGPTSGITIIRFYDDNADDAGFVRRFRGTHPPADSDEVLFDITLYDCVAGARDAWVTGFMLQPDPADSDDPADFGDGETAGWAWDGAAHNSASRTVESTQTVLINGGACVVFDPAVTLALNPGSVAATEMAIRNDEDGYGAWEAFAATKAWMLSAACKVWAKFRDGA